MDWLSNNGKFWISIRPASECLFSRRLGYNGWIVFGYSIKLRLFGRKII